MTPAQQTLVLEQIAGRMATLNDLLMLAQATTTDSERVLLIDAATGMPIAQADAEAAGSYAFVFANRLPGTYLLAAGSDLDNDGYICDAGESCGIYPSFALPGAIVLGALKPGEKLTENRLSASLSVACTVMGCPINASSDVTVTARTWGPKEVM